MVTNTKRPFNDWVNMKNYVSYIRVSTDKQGKSGLGLDAQRALVHTYIKQKNGVLVQEFQEVESGKDRDREQLKRALDYCRKNNMTLIVGKLDRLSRDVRFFLEILDDSKVRIEFADLPDINANDPSGRMILTAMSVFAEFERNRISERTKDALAIAKERGVKLGKAGKDNIKRVNQDRSIKADEFALSLSNVINGLKAQGLSQRQIVIELNKLEVKSYRGGEWSLSSLQNTMKRIERVTNPSKMN